MEFWSVPVSENNLLHRALDSNDISEKDFSSFFNVEIVCFLIDCNQPSLKLRVWQYTRDITRDWTIQQTVSLHYRRYPGFGVSENISEQLF